MDTTGQEPGISKKSSSAIVQSPLGEDGPSFMKTSSNPNKDSSTFIEEEGKEVVESLSVGMSYQKLDSEDECDRFQTINGRIDDALALWRLSPVTKVDVVKTIVKIGNLGWSL